MKEMTKANLSAAFAGESQAHMKYLAFADIAERDGFLNVARLFRAASFAEQMHATAHLRALGGTGNTVANLDAALGGETFEVDEMYPAYSAVAKTQDEKGAVQSMERALEAEKIHAQLYTRAKESAAAKKDFDLSAIFVCEVCGWTVEGAAPDKCPLCGAPAKRFRQF
ncbi:MAG: rubrerythrin family protein [Chloroflexota bacterium]